MQGNILRTTTNALRSYRGFVDLLTFKMAFILTLSDVREDFKKNLVIADWYVFPYSIHINTIYSGCSLYTNTTLVKMKSVCCI